MNLIIILIISAIAQYFLPWWVIAPISFVFCAWKSDSPKAAYIAAAGAIALLWTAYLVYLNISTGGVLTDKVAKIFTAGSALEKLPAIGFLGAVTMLIGSQVAGLSGLAGHYFRKFF
jgi:hypothetical protein